MKTLIIFFPSIESGGVEKIFYHLLNNFSLKFKKVIVAISSKIEKNKIIEEKYYKILTKHFKKK